MAIIPFEDRSPVIPSSCFCAPDSWIIGDVMLGENVSVFFSAVLRGDIQKIRVGSGSNIQEHALLHSSHDLPDCVVGNNVTIGHRAIIHGCTISDNCIIGMGSTILDGAVIGENCIIGAQALVPMHAQIPPGSLVLGIPAKVVRKLTEKEIRGIETSAHNYIATGQTYREYFSR